MKKMKEFNRGVKERNQRLNVLSESKNVQAAINEQSDFIIKNGGESEHYIFNFSKINKNVPPISGFIEFFAFKTEEKRFQASLRLKKRIKA